MENFESLQGEVRIDVLDDVRGFSDEFDHAAGANHAGVIAELGPESRDHALDKGRVAVDRARHQAFLGRPADISGRFSEFDHAEKGGIFGECLVSGPEPRTYRAADIFLVPCDGAECEGGSEVDDDLRDGIKMGPRDSVYDAVSAYFSRVIVFDRKLGPYSGLDDKGIDAEILGRNTSECACQGRYDG